MTLRTLLLRILAAGLLVAAATVPAFAQGASTWFLAEGASNGVFDQDILVGNPSATLLTVTVRMLPAPDAVITPGAALEKPFALPATGRLTVNVRREFPGLNGAASAQVSAVVANTSTPADIVVERSMFFPLTGTPYAGGTGASGVVAPATRWILAEGSGGAFQTFILLVNPGTTPANVTVRYLGQDQRTVTTSRVIEGGRRETLWPNAQHAELANQGFSTVVESDSPIVAERAMYFDDYRSGHDALGVAAPGADNGRTEWYFAEGFTGANAAINTAFETFLLIGNDNASPVTVTATYFLDAGAPVQKSYTVAPRSRFNIWVDEEKAADGTTPLLPPTAFSVRLESTIPIVAERAVYWGTPLPNAPTTPAFPWREGHVVAGIERPEAKWAFAEGRQGEDGSGGTFDSFFLVVNPNASALRVRAVFATEDGTGVTTEVDVAASTRANIWPSAGLPDFALLQGRRFAVFLESLSGQPFVAERAMYWNGYVGGHANAGAPWSGAFVAPAAAPVDVRITGMTPGSGRMSGGTVVTIRGREFSDTPVVSFGGVRVPVSRILTDTATGDRLVEFAVPTRTIATGFGAAGPVNVSIEDRGRFVRAPNFTRYFSVLAFGDSITWGTSNTYIGGIRVPVNIQRPYPRGLRDELQGNAQFGPYALVSNAGWPGEWASQGGYAGSVGGVLRSARCSAGQANCFYPIPGTQPNPRDYFTPHDVAVFLEGVNDINGGEPDMGRIRNAMRSMVVDAKSKGLQALLLLFGPYGNDQITGQPATYPDKVRQYNDLLDALATEQNVFREYVSAQMSPDGLHPNQTGYDEMAEAVYRKLLTMFPRCGAGVATCP